MAVTFIAYVTLVLAGVYVAYQRYFSHLASIPGPFSASLSRYWLVKHTRRGDMHREMLRMHGAYGPLVRTGPNEISVVDPPAIKKIYGMHILVMEYRHLC